MGIFDSLGGFLAPNVYGPESQGLTTGYNLAQPYLAQALQGIQGATGQAVPFLQQQYGAALPYMANVYNVGAAGTGQLEKLLGIGGGPSSAATMQQTLAGMPGYQFTRNQGIGAINAANAASGATGSGTADKALADYVTGLANQNYSSYVNQLAPFLNTMTQGAGGVSNLFTGLGSGVSNLLTSGASAAGGALGNLANLGWGYGTGLGAAGAQQNVANANYGLAGLSGLASLLGGALGGSGSGLSALGSGLYNAIPGLGSNMLSDERLKKDVEKVGETYDGLGIFKYKYLWDETPRIGLMAQEVEKREPAAVIDFNGWKAVNYDKATSRAAQIARFLEAA
jgi:hypothetical protein